MVSSPAMIRPVPVSAAYRASVALAALAMLATPVLYLGFVGLVAAGVAAWALVGLAWVGNAWFLLLHLTVLAAGLTVLFFLGKVFFARPRMDGGFQAIDLAKHEALAGLIGRVCEATGAPEPAEVAVDMSLNGSASLIHPLRGLVNNRYRLTLGLPLVAISDQQHMAHVIAHEVGHFSQGGAMRVRQLIHWSEYYLSRLVDGRDRWDVWLASRPDGASYLVHLFAWAAAFGIWVSRRVLRLLLQGTLLVNARMSREMEFHADLYAIRVAGTRAFAESVETFAGGKAAMQRGLRIAQRAEADGRYPEDVAELTAECFARIPAEERRELARQGRYTIGLGYDSHPDDTDRLARSEEEHDEGTLRETGAAALLFTDFAGLCRAETRRFFGVDGKACVPVAVLIEEDEARDAQDAGRIDFFGAVYDGPVWLRVGAVEPVSDGEWREAIEAGDEARAATLGSLQEIVGCYSKLVRETVILRWLEARVAVDWRRLEVEPCEAEAARERMYAREREYWATVEKFHETASPIRRRLMAAWARRGRLGLERQTLFDRLLTEMRAMEAADEATTRLAIDIAVLADLGASINDNLRNSFFMQTIQSEFEAAVRHAGAFEGLLAADLLAYARPVPMDEAGGVGAYLQTYGTVLGRIRDRRLRMMGELAELALEVERRGL